MLVCWYQGTGMNHGLTGFGTADVGVMRCLLIHDRNEHQLLLL